MSEGRPLSKFIRIFIMGMVTIHCPHLSLAFSGTDTPSLLAKITGTQFAPEKWPIARVDLQINRESESKLSNPNTDLALTEFHFDSFFETDRQGDQSFDLDPILWRIALIRNSYLWIGRTHPAQEMISRTHRQPSPLSPTSAIGARWVQNQSRPLTPRVSGWLGVGSHWQIPQTRTSLTVSYSPFFLPHTGPALQFSETAQATGSRFARLPPQEISVHGQILPLYYQIQPGEIRDIVLQPQYFVELGQDFFQQRISLITWSAPSPTPKIDASGVLKVTAESVFALATVHPSFPRENFYAFRWINLHSPLNSELEIVYESQSKRSTLSCSIQYQQSIQAGYLTSSPPSHEYAQNLVWLEIQGTFFSNQLSSSLRIEQHLNKGQEDQWTQGQIEYKANEHLSTMITARSLTGTDSSYLAAWKILDSLAFGAAYRW